MKLELDSVLGEPSGVLALAEMICPTLNGPRARIFVDVIESHGNTHLLTEEADLALSHALSQLDRERIIWWQHTLDQAQYQVLDVRSPRYPSNLQLVQDRPPFLFVRGDLDPRDSWSIAIVGSRSAGMDRLDYTRDIATQLCASGLTIVSGLAAGIDTAAHEAALASDGRTIAVFGTGISKVFPGANRSLAAKIIRHSAALSQFWPDMSGTKWSFPIRNAVTSGVSLGTLVIEAGEKSGTRSQVLAALQHGRFVFFPQDLVDREPWTHELLQHTNVVVFTDPFEIIHVLESQRELAMTALAF